jgi:hypothetical protein
VVYVLVLIGVLIHVLNCMEYYSDGLYLSSRFTRLEDISPYNHPMPV